jgi:small GTP-binding protein
VRIKVVAVGDGAVGKTSLLWAYAFHEIPPEYVPTVFDNYATNVQVEKTNVSLQLWDTAGQEDLQNIRVLSYTNTDVFLVCFSIAEPTSLENISTKWWIELKNHVKHPIIILVGTKKDLRTDNAIVQRLSHLGQTPVTPDEGKAKAREIDAVGYCECSAMQQDGVSNIFDLAILEGMKPRKNRKCLLL